MDQHLIALDMDGTTLNNQSKLTDHTVSTLRRLANDGHLVVIVTGRPWLISRHTFTTRSASSRRSSILTAPWPTCPTKIGSTSTPLR